MAKSYQRRYEQANNIAAGAYATFEKAAEEFEVAARLHRAVFDDLQEKIEELSTLAADAAAHGTRASRRARKIREFFGAEE